MTCAWCAESKDLRREASERDCLCLSIPEHITPRPENFKAVHHAWAICSVCRNGLVRLRKINPPPPGVPRVVGVGSVACCCRARCSVKDSVVYHSSWSARE